MKIQVLLVIILFKSYLGFGQNNRLTVLREKYCNTNCDFYDDHIKFLNALPDFPTSESKREDKFLKLFNIPLKERLNLFPFSEYDSIYIIKTKYVLNENEPRDYFDTKYYKTMKLMKKRQVKRFSNILFNFYEVKNSNFTFINKEKIGCECIEREYPQLILLFVKNGKKDYIGFPYYAYNVEGKRTSFSEDEFESFDISNEKVKMILKYFNAYDDDFFDD